MTISTPIYSEFNVYDVREPCVDAGLCYPNNYIEDFLNSDLYRKKFKIQQPIAWEECADLPHIALSLDMNKMAGYKLSFLLDIGVPILIYNGDKDYICNWMGGLAWTEALEWSGQPEFNSN